MGFERAGRAEEGAIRANTGSSEDTVEVLGS